MGPQEDTPEASLPELLAAPAVGASFQERVRDGPSIFFCQWQRRDHPSPLTIYTFSAHDNNAVGHAWLPLPVRGDDLEVMISEPVFLSVVLLMAYAVEYVGSTIIVPIIREAHLLGVIETIRKVVLDQTTETGEFNRLFNGSA